MVDVSGYLASKGLPLKRADARNVHTACLFCGEDPAARGRLYINIDPDADIAGLYFCFKCQAKGGLASLKRHFGDEVGGPELDHQTRLDIFNTAAAYYHSALRDFGEVAEYLTGPQRGLTVDTVGAYRLGYAPMQFSYDVATEQTTVTRPNHLYRHLVDADFDVKDILATGLCHETQSRIVDALGGMVTIPYLVAGSCVAIRGRTWPSDAADFATWNGAEYTPPPNKYKTCGGSSSRLFNTDSAWDTEEVVVTEGEFDAIVLEQNGFKAVAAPGATSWQESWDDYLTNIRRVWLLYDRDQAGEKAAERLVERLGTKVRRIFLSEEGTKCDPTEWFARDGHSAEEFEELLAIGRKGALLVSVREAMHEHQNVQSQPGLKFGWELFDIMLDPGLQAGQLMLILAKTGSYKTLLLLNLMHRARMVRDDLKVLFVSLEQTRGEWWDRARRMHRFFDLDANEEDAARWWERNIMLVDRNRVTTAELRQVLDDYAYQMGGPPDLMCLDYLGYWARSFKGEAYQRTSDAVMAVKGIAKEFLIPTIVPHQVSRIGIDGQEFGPEAARDSVTGDALITLADGRRVPIVELEGQQPDVVVLSDDMRFTTRRADRVWCKGERDVYQVGTRSGRTLRCTASHPLLSIYGWHRLDELQVGDSIAVPRDIPVAGEQSFSHAELVGALIADGGLTRSPITFTKAQGDIRSHVAQLAQELGVVATPKPGEPLTIVFSNGNRGGVENPLTEHIRAVGAWGHRSQHRRVPDGIWVAPLIDVAAFLRGIWSCDGTITNRGLKYSSASEGLARDLVALLLRFGIGSTLARERYQEGGYVEGFYWTVTVRSGVDITQFAKWIGLIGGKGVALDRLTVRASTRQPDKWDSLPPDIWHHIQHVRRSKGLTWAEAFGASGVDERRGLSRSRALHIGDRLQDDWLRQIATGHLRFEPITLIEPVGREPVYDMSVAGIHNFIANEIVVKNSGVVEETADHLLTMWTPDNTLGREEEEKTGAVHLRIGKSRHGGRGVLLNMQFAPVSLVMLPEGDPQCAMARREITWKREYRDNWDKVVYRHRTGFEGHLVDSPLSAPSQVQAWE